jgi:hypothetical protein
MGTTLLLHRDKWHLPVTVSKFAGVNLVCQNTSSSNKTKDRAAWKPSRNHNIQEHPSVSRCKACSWSGNSEG